MRQRIFGTTPRGEALALGTALALALVLRLHGIGWGLPGVYEEAYPFKKAWDMWGFGPLRGFDLDPHWFRYPSLTLYLQMVGQALSFALLRLGGVAHSMVDVRLLYIFDRTTFYLIGRSITVLFGAATVLAVWAFGRRAAGPRAATVAALLVAIHPGLIEKSQVIEVDVPLTCLATAALAAALALIERPQGRQAWTAGLLAGLAASAKYPGLLLAVPLALAAWLGTRSGRGDRAAAPVAPARAPAAARGGKGRPGARAAAAPRARTARAPGAVGLALHALAALGLAFVLTSPFVLLDFRSFWRDLAAERGHMAAGHFGIAGGPALFAYARDWFTAVMGWPLGIAALAGLVLFAARRRPWAWIAASFLVPYLAIVGSWQMKADRYLLPLVPLGVVLAAALLDEGVRALERRSRPLAIGASVAGAALLAAPLIAWLPARWAAVAPDTRTLARAWIERHLAPGSLIVTEAYGPEVFSPLDLQSLDPDLAQALDARGAQRRLYGLQQMPMFQVQPERSAKYYSLSHLPRQDPARFAPQIAFYDSLDARWPRLVSFAPSHQPGPTITIYRNPAVTQPFGFRTPPTAPDSTFAVAGPVTGGEGFYYYNLGTIHAAFGQVEEAHDSYLLAVRFGGNEPDIYVNAGARLVGSLWDEGRQEAAMAVLAELMRRAPGPRQVAQLNTLRDRLQGPGASSPIR